MMETYLSPGVFGLETLITNTSAYGPKASTPDTKSAVESAGDALFFPKLTARMEPGRRDAGTSALSGRNGEIRARSRERTDAWPSDGNPYRLINAPSSGRWKTRGRGFPGCQICVSITRLLGMVVRTWGFGVMLPISTQLNPRLSKPEEVRLVK